jgi:hypothetical protein
LECTYYPSQHKSPEDHHLSNCNKLTNQSNTKLSTVLKHCVMNVYKGMGAKLHTF